MDAQATDVADPGQRGGQFGQLGSRQRQWVATGQDDFVQRIVGADGVQCGLPAPRGGGLGPGAPCELARA
jgi:hypothetical protein